MEQMLRQAADRRLFVLRGSVPAPLLPQQKLRRFICYFYETIKVTKSVFKKKGPLENFLWGERHRFAVSTSPTVP